MTLTKKAAGIKKPLKVLTINVAQPSRLALYTVRAKNGHILGQAKAQDYHGAAKLYGIDTKHNGRQGNSALTVFDSGHKIKLEKKRKGHLQKIIQDPTTAQPAEQRTFRQVFGLKLISIVDDVLRYETGYRSSLPQLRKSVIQNAFDKAKAKLQAQVRHHELLALNSKGKESKANLALAAGAKDAILALQRRANGFMTDKNFLNNVANARSVIRKELGIDFDCRTLNSVPDRNMIEPNYYAIAA